MGDILYKNEEWLRQKYIDEKYSLPEIAKICNVSCHTIHYWTNKFNIKCRLPGLAYINISKDYLYKNYILDDLSIKQIAKLYGCSKDTITRRLKDYEIPLKINRNLNTFNKNDLYNMYVENQLSINQISDYYNCSSTKIRMALINNNIKIRSHSESARNKLNPAWKGGITEQKYCYKFNDQFKEYIREKFNRTCYICGKTEDELNRKLAVHHIDYNKSSICNGKEFAFVPLCHSCHAKTNGNRYHWFNLLINYWLDKYEIYNDLTMY